MLRLSLFLLLSLALHIAGWLLHGETQAPALSAAQSREALQVLRLGAVLQTVAPAPVKQPEQAQRQAVAPSKAEAAQPSAQVPVARSSPVKAAAPAKRPPAQVLQAKAPTPPAVVVGAAQSAPAKPLVTQPTAEVLSTKPSFREPPRQPDYPSQARRRNQQGVVMVEVRLDERGQQRSLNVLRSSGVDSLDRAALEAVAQWRFYPETSGGQAVPSRVQIPIQFALTASR